MDRRDWQPLSKDPLIASVLQLQRPDKTSPTLHAREPLRLSAKRLQADRLRDRAPSGDLAVDMFGKLIGGAWRKAEIGRKERRLEEADVLTGVAVGPIEFRQALMKARETGTDLWTSIDGTIGSDGLAAGLAAASRNGPSRPERRTR